MRRFRYCLDPVFLTAAALYLVNRWLLKPLESHAGFFHAYGNDLLCIPFCLPPCLWVYRRIRLRDHDRMPTCFELLTHLVVWSIYFEAVAPRLGGPFAWTVGDLWDAVAYAVGGAVAAAAWGTFRARRPVPAPAPAVSAAREAHS